MMGPIRFKYLLAVVLLPFAAQMLHAQDLAVTTNVLDYADRATLNVGLSYGMFRHLSVEAEAKYNPFTFPSDVADKSQDKQRLLALGCRYWPWHIFSGWWMETRLQYQEYSNGGFSSPETSEGDRFGGGLSGGYTYMINKHLNLDLGAGVWVGTDSYRIFSCPTCGAIKDSGRKFFALPDNVVLGLSYIF